MWRANSLERTLMLGKIEGRKRRGRQRVRWLNGVTNLMDMSFSKLQEMVNDREPWRDAVLGVTKSQTGLHNWTTTTKEIWFDKTSTSASLTMLKPLTVCITTNWKILKKMGIPDHLTCLLKNLYSGQEATVRTGQRTTDWFQIGKRVHLAVFCHPAYLTYIQSTSCEMLSWIKHRLESRLPGEISITSDTQMTPQLWEKVKKN